MNVIPFLLLIIGLILLIYSKVIYIKENYSKDGNSGKKANSIKYSLYGSYFVLGLAILSAVILKV